MDKSATSKPIERQRESHITLHPKSIQLHHVVSRYNTKQYEAIVLYCTVLRKDRNIGLLGHAMISVTITASSLKERTLLETNRLHRTVDNCTTFIEQSDVYAVKSCIQRCNMEVLCLCTINRLGKYVQ